eukprot:gene808-3996_t
MSKAVDAMQRLLDPVQPPDVGLDAEEGGADLSNGWTAKDAEALANKDCGQKDFFRNMCEAATCPCPTCKGKGGGCMMYSSKG